MLADRPRVIDTSPPRPPKPKNRGEPNEPKGGCYWMKGLQMIPITGTCNKITNLSGQHVLTEPEEFGFSTDDIMDFLKSHRFGAGDDYDASGEYTKYLAGNAGDLTRMASLWKASKLAYEYALKNGWLWVSYQPPEKVHFVVTPDAAQRQIAACSDRLSLMQIDKVFITIATKFDNISDKYPQMSDNKTLTFDRAQIGGWMGAFGAALDWTHGKEAPSSNYLYMVVQKQEPISDYQEVSYARFFSATKRTVLTPQGRLTRWALVLKSSPMSVADDQVLLRIPASLGHKVGMGVTAPNSKGNVFLYGDRFPHIKENDIEIQQDGQWHHLS